MEQKAKIRDVYYLVFYYLIILACICSVISQAPIIIANGALKSLMTYVPWILAILYGLITSVRIYYKDLKLLILSIIFIVYDKAIGYFGINTHIIISWACLIATFILFLGIIVGKNLDKKDFLKILKYYTYAVIAFSIYLYIEVFGRVLFADAASSVVIEGGKNSLGIVLLSALALLLLNKDFLPKTKYVFIVFILFMVVLIKSRTTMLSAAALLIFKIFIGGEKLKGKVVYGVVLTIVAVILFSNDTFYNVVIKQIFLQGKDFSEENYESITSGRYNNYQWAWKMFKQNWLLGNGYVGYVESFYYGTLMYYGIIGCTILYAFVFSPIFICIRDRKDKEDRDLRVNLFIVAIIMYVAGFGEAQAPFGPGVKCFLLWFLLGYYIGYRNRKKEIVANEIISDNPGL